MEMKEHLVNLLLEEYKQHCLFMNLLDNGIDLSDIAVQNSEIVFDIIGFPKDNGREYRVNLMLESEKDRKEIDENYFTRDWLFEEYEEVSESIRKNQKIEVTEKGLQLVDEKDEILTRKKFTAFVDWLYQEYFKLKL